MPFKNPKGYWGQVSDTSKRESRTGDPSSLWKPQQSDSLRRVVAWG